MLCTYSRQSQRWGQQYLVRTPSRDRKLELAGWVGVEVHPSLITRIKAQTQSERGDPSKLPSDRFWWVCGCIYNCMYTSATCSVSTVFTTLVLVNGRVVLGRVWGGKWRNKATRRWQTLVQRREAWGATLAYFWVSFSFLLVGLETEPKGTLNEHSTTHTAPVFFSLMFGKASAFLPCANKYY